MKVLSILLTLLCLTPFCVAEETKQKKKKLNLKDQKQIHQLVTVSARDIEDETPVSELKEGENIHPSWEGAPFVIVVHPHGQFKPSKVDFSKITEERKGKLQVALRNHPNHDCVAVIKVGTKKEKKILIKGNKWTKVTIPFNKTSVVVEGHSGGKNPWMYEFLSLSFKFTK
jgi:hypothetical protein